MRTRIFLLCLLAVLTAHAQAPLVRNSFSTNTLWSGTTGLRYIPSVTPTLQLESLQIAPARFFMGGIDGTSHTNNVDIDGEGNASFSGSLTVNLATITNQLTLPYATASTMPIINSSKRLVSLANGAEGTFLGISNGVPAYINGTGNVTNTYNTINATNITVQNNLTVSNFFTVNGKNNTLIITNQLTLQSVKTNILATDGTGLVTNAVIGSGLDWDTSTRTLTASTPTTSAGMTITNFVRMPWVTLTYSGTNVAGPDLSAGSMFKLTLTNNTFLQAPSNLPGTNVAQIIQVHVAEDGTGGYSLTLTNGSYVVSGSGTSSNAVAGVTTNANAVTILTFATSPFTATKLYSVVAATGP